MWAFNNRHFLLRKKTAVPSIKKRQRFLNGLTRPERQCGVAGCCRLLRGRTTCECLLLQRTCDIVGFVLLGQVSDLSDVTSPVRTLEANTAAPDNLAKARQEEPSSAPGSLPHKFGRGQTERRRPRCSSSASTSTLFSNLPFCSALRVLSVLCNPEPSPFPEHAISV